MKTPPRKRTSMGKTKLSPNKSGGGKSSLEDEVRKSQNLSTFGAIFDRLKNVIVKLGLASASKRMLSTTDYYHYYVPREEVDQMLKNEGEFLLRAIVTRDARIAVILSIRGEHKKIDHIIVEYKPSTKLFHFIKEIGRECIPDLVEYHVEKRIPVFGHILKRPVIKCWEEVLGDRVELNTNKILGEGNFAVVYKGKFRIARDKWIRMACKKIKIDKCKSQFDKLEAKRQIIREYDISRTCIHHPNVLSIYGILIETEEVALLMEFCDGGAVDSYLKKNTISVAMKVNILFGAAKGVQFLHRSSLIHRDLSGRNLLLVKRTKQGLMPQVKVSDFGLTRSGPMYKMAQRHEIPYLISGMECLAVNDAHWSYKSDVWSFGVLIWEVFHNSSAEPYAEDFVCMDSEMLLEHLKSGKRLPKSSDMPTVVAEVMESCFKENENDRPSMDLIAQRLVTMVCELETAATHGCKSKPQPYHYQRSDIFSQLMLVTDWGRLAKRKAELDRNDDDETKETPHTNAKKSASNKTTVNEKQATGGGQSSLRIKKKSEDKN